MSRSTIKKLNREEQQKLFLILCESITNVKTMEESASLLADLFSPQEQEMIAKRLYIAKLLLEGKTYDKIESQLKVGRGTIAKVNAWLEESGVGYRLVATRSNSKNLKISEKVSSTSWRSLKKRYSMYYWPQLLLEDVIRSANSRQRKKLFNTLKILKQSKKKHEIFQQIERVLKEDPKIKYKAS